MAGLAQRHAPQRSAAAARRLKFSIPASAQTLAPAALAQRSPQHKLHWLAEQALNWSVLPVVHLRPTVMLEVFFLVLTPDSVSKSNQIRLTFREDNTSPVAVQNVARAVTTLLIDPQPHVGKIYHLTGPRSENMYFYAQQYSEALGQSITFRDIPVEQWRDGLLERGLPVHLLNHLVTMADLHRTERYDRLYGRRAQANSARSPERAGLRPKNVVKFAVSATQA